MGGYLIITMVNANTDYRRWRDMKPSFVPCMPTGSKPLAYSTHLYCLMRYLNHQVHLDNNLLLAKSLQLLQQLPFPLLIQVDPHSSASLTSNEKDLILMNYWITNPKGIKPVTIHGTAIWRCLHTWVTRLVSILTRL